MDVSVCLQLLDSRWLCHEMICGLEWLKKMRGASCSCPFVSGLLLVFLTSVSLLAHRFAKLYNLSEWIISPAAPPLIHQLSQLKTEQKHGHRCSLADWHQSSQITANSFWTDFLHVDFSSDGSNNYSHFTQFLMWNAWNTNYSHPIPHFLFRFIIFIVLI